MFYKKKEKIDPDKLAVCGYCNNEFFKANMRRCPNPIVQELCGEYICYYCCRSCSFGVKTDDISGVVCTFK